MHFRSRQVAAGGEDPELKALCRAARGAGSALKMPSTLPGQKACGLG